MPTDPSNAPLEAQEDESDLFVGKNPPFSAAIASSDWTAETIIGQLRKGNIDLDPSFQRREAWKDDRKSKFIESLMLDMPTPQIILAERKDSRGKYLVIDGKQRLLTLRQFTAKPDEEFRSFALRGLLAKPELNGETFSRLWATAPDDISTFENATIRTVVIKNWSSEEFLYEVFLRINSGSVQLSPQELRQALRPGPFTARLNSYAEDAEQLRRVLKIDEPDFRMRDNEIILRYLAFRDRWGTYSGNLKQFLDDTTDIYNTEWSIHESNVEEHFKNLDQALTTGIEIFGDNAFKKWNGKSYERRLNRAVFDFLAYYWSVPEFAAASVEKKPEIEAAFKDLCEQREFSEAISTTTKSLNSVILRFDMWRDKLAEILELKIELPLE
jgi:hypothetical protein